MDDVNKHFHLYSVKLLPLLNERERNKRLTVNLIVSNTLSFIDRLI